MVIYLIKSSILVTPFVILFLMVGIVLRSWNLNRCYSCGARKIRPARTSGFLERFAGIFGIHPLRCECCRARFYAFGTATADAEPDAIRELQPRFVIHVVFRRTEGIFDGVVIRRIALRPAHILREIENRKPGSLSGSPAMFLHS